MPTKNYYKILQLDPCAEPEVVTAAYKRLALKYHPDTNPSVNAHLRMQELNEAYAVLSDPERRARFDRERMGHTASTTTAPAPASAGRSMRKYYPE